jgi:hypothetical protein
MDNQVILKRIAGIKFRQVIYVGAGIYFLITGLISKEWTMDILSVLFLYQGVFNTCLFGTCRVPKHKEF